MKALLLKILGYVWSFSLMIAITILAFRSSWPYSWLVIVTILIIVLILVPHKKIFRIK